MGTGRSDRGLATGELGIPKGNRLTPATAKVLIAVAVIIPLIMILPLWGVGWMIFYSLGVLGFDRALEASTNPMICILFGLTFSGTWVVKYYHAWMRAAIAGMQRDAEP